MLEVQRRRTPIDIGILRSRSSQQRLSLTRARFFLIDGLFVLTALIVVGLAREKFDVAAFIFAGAMLTLLAHADLRRTHPAELSVLEELVGIVSRLSVSSRGLPETEPRPHRRSPDGRSNGVPMLVDGFLTSAESKGSLASFIVPSHGLRTTDGAPGAKVSGDESR